MDCFGRETTPLVTLFVDHNYVAITPRWRFIPPHFSFIWMAKIGLKTNPIACDCSHRIIHLQATHSPKQSLRCAALWHIDERPEFHAIH